MIIRKPYAFLIKNFKKIHIILLLLSLFVVYKTFDVTNFVNDFMRFGVYDSFTDPVTRHISIWLQLSLLLLVLGSAAILFLLRYKNKQWKLYLIPIIEYFALFFVLNMIKSFFGSYSTGIESTDVRLSRDLLIIFAIGQVPAIWAFVMRVFGLDKNKFDFKLDEEFLNLDEKDREEVEINIDIDKNSIKRFWKRTVRNTKYFYEEHRYICIGIVVILIAGIGINSYKYFFVTNKSYEEGEIYSANGYTMRINKVYFTDKDYAGNVISKKSNFVIVDVAVKNNSVPRTIEMENFHVRNTVKDFVSTRTTYAKEFVDLGKTYDIVKELKRDEETSFIIVFKVDKNLNKNKFVVCYQEKDGYLRKIQADIVDLSEVKKEPHLEKGEVLKIETVANPDEVSFDWTEVTTEASFVRRDCNVEKCRGVIETIQSDGSYKILKIEFGSEIYTSTQMLQFLTRHGKIVYKNANGEDEEVEIKNAINRRNFGKEVFLKVPNEVTNNTELTLNLVIRNKEYNYILN